MLASFQKQYGMLTIFPQCRFLLEFPDILSQKLICYHRLSVFGNSGIMHCGIPINMAYSEKDSITYTTIDCVGVSLPLLCDDHALMCLSSYSSSVSRSQVNMQTSCRTTSCWIHMSRFRWFILAGRRKDPSTGCTATCWKREEWLEAITCILSCYIQATLHILEKLQLQDRKSCSIFVGSQCFTLEKPQRYIVRLYLCYRLWKKVTKDI